jgi:hypothetical protein
MPLIMDHTTQPIGTSNQTEQSLVARYLTRVLADFQPGSRIFCGQDIRFSRLPAHPPTIRFNHGRPRVLQAADYSQFEKTVALIIAKTIRFEKPND